MSAAAMTADNPDDATTYAYRPSVLGATWSFRLTPDAIAWDAGRRSGRIAYGDVARVRMSFRPATLQSQRFLTEIWSRDGTKLRILSSSWKSMVEQTRLDDSYRAFVVALHRRLAGANARVDYVSGASPFLYWLGLATFVATSLVIAALIVRVTQAGAAGAALLIAAFLAGFLWQAGGYFRRNLPGRYSPDTLPLHQLPAPR
jgi:hypothetical protein